METSWRDCYKYLSHQGYLSSSINVLISFHIAETRYTTTKVKGGKVYFWFTAFTGFSPKSADFKVGQHGRGYHRRDNPWQNRQEAEQWAASLSVCLFVCFFLVLFFLFIDTSKPYILRWHIKLISNIHEEYSYVVKYKHSGTSVQEFSFFYNLETNGHVCVCIGRMTGCDCHLM